MWMVYRLRAKCGWCIGLGLNADPYIGLGLNVDRCIGLGLDVDGILA